MNQGQFKAMLWVRWRILANRLSRRGKINNVLFGLLAILGVVVGIGVFLGAIFMGLALLPTAGAMDILGTWTGLSLGFLFFWMMGLMVELSRSDSMSFKNLLHLPVSLGWVFIYNYLSSFVALSIGFFLPAMLGLAVAMTKTFGPSMLLCFPLILGFFLLVTALTYHLRGWLARLMEDKRKGKNVIMGITFCFVLLMQMPNFINMANREDNVSRRAERFKLELKAEHEGPNQAAAQEELEAFRARENLKDLAFENQIALATQVIPFGWLAYGIRAIFLKSYLPTIFSMLGLFLLSGLSLRRSYRTTLRGIVEGGGHGSGKATVQAKGELPELKQPRSGNLMVERNLPFLGNATSGVALTNLRALLRAPETKMMLLGPLIMFGFMGMMLAKNDDLEAWRPFAPGMALGAISMGLISINQLLQNQFGLDRAGFRAFLLSPVPRYQILIGKNLTLAPFGIGIGLISLCGLQWFMPADLTHFLGGILQIFSAFLLLCLLGNMLSIYAPIRMREMGTKAVKPKFTTFILQFFTLIFVPLTLSPLLLPWGAEFMLQNKAWAASLPLYLLFHILMLLGSYLLYRGFIRVQGVILQEREQDILDILTRD